MGVVETLLTHAVSKAVLPPYHENRQYHYHSTALQAACEGEQTEVVSLLLKTIARDLLLEAKCLCRTLSLRKAAECGYEALVQLLLDDGVDDSRLCKRARDAFDNQGIGELAETTLLAAARNRFSKPTGPTVRDQRL